MEVDGRDALGVSERACLLVFSGRPGERWIWRGRALAQDARDGGRNLAHVDYAEVAACGDTFSHNKEGGAHFGTVGQVAMRSGTGCGLVNRTRKGISNIGPGLHLDQKRRVGKAAHFGEIRLLDHTGDGAAERERRRPRDWARCRSRRYLCRAPALAIGDRRTARRRADR